MIVWVRIPPSRLIDVVGSLMVERTVVAREDASSSLVFPPRSIVNDAVKTLNSILRIRTSFMR